jgi:hypothetical protein
MRDVVADSLLLCVAICLFVIEFFTFQPIIKGFLRLRCVLKLPFMYSLLVANFAKKVTHILYETAIINLSL